MGFGTIPDCTGCDHDDFIDPPPRSRSLSSTGRLLPFRRTGGSRCRAVGLYARRCKARVVPVTQAFSLSNCKVCRKQSGLPHNNGHRNQKGSRAMRRTRVLPRRFEHVWKIALAGLVIAVAAGPRVAHGQFQELAKSLPRSANSIVIFNLEKAKASPMGIREGWKEKSEKAFADGVIRVPPQAVRVVITAQLNFETMDPAWEAAALDLNQPLSMSAIAKTYAGQEEKVEGLDTVSLPNGAYAVALRPHDARGWSRSATPAVRLAVAARTNSAEAPGAFAVSREGRRLLGPDGAARSSRPSTSEGVSAPRIMGA